MVLFDRRGDDPRDADAVAAHQRMHRLAAGVDHGAVHRFGIAIAKGDAAVVEAAEALYLELQAAGIEAVLDDRGLRPGAMFADIELIGIPHRVVVSGRGLEAGTFEYRSRAAAESENLDRDSLRQRLGF